MNIRKITYLLTAFLFAATTLFAVPKKVEAQSANPQCLGVALADYMNTVIDITTACGITNTSDSKIKLLSPAFNMTNTFAFPIISAATGAGADWGALYGISGNAYQLSYGTVLEHVTRFMSGSGLPNKPIFITETGYFSGSQDSLRSDLIQIKSGSAAEYSFIGAAFFAAVAELNDEWDDFYLTDGQISYYCGDGPCGTIGFNSADYYTNVDDIYYNRASGLGMQTTVSIVNLDPGNHDAVIRAKNNGFIPVIRVGHGGLMDDVGLTAEEYGAFLCGLEQDTELTGRVYAIAGPNEPQSEYWFAPQCGLTPIDLGDDRRPEDEGFHLGLYPCGETADTEFHTLRRYPASPCDPLIPRSIPEAPQSLEPGSWNKYLTYACGTSLEFSTIGSFNPYGLADTTETFTNRAGNEFLVTYCEPRTNLDGWEPVTCYRSVRFVVGMYFDQSKVGILGNTQLTRLNPAQKVNNYLSWYWTGIPQVGDNYTGYQIGETYEFGGEEIAYEDMIINYTGPVRKLMPAIAQSEIREVIRDSQSEEVHNYLVHDTTAGPEDGVEGSQRMSFIPPQSSEFWKNIPLSSLEDVAGEVFFTSFGAGVGAMGDPANPDLTTSPFQFTIICAVGAHENCP